MHFFISASVSYSEMLGLTEGWHNWVLERSRGAIGPACGKVSLSKLSEEAPFCCTICTYSSCHPSPRAWGMLWLWVIKEKFVPLFQRLVGSWCQPAMVYWLFTELLMKQPNLKELCVSVVCSSSHSLISKPSTDHFSVIIVFESTVSIVLCTCLLRKVFYTALWQLQWKHSQLW